MQTIRKIKIFFENRSRLDLFLLKAGGLVLIYYVFRILIKFTPFLRPVFVFSRDLLINILVKSSHFLLLLFGQDSQVYGNIVYITGSQGVKVINTCIGWAIMALFIGFIIIYPGHRKTKYWYIPIGLIVIIIINIFRITVMALISMYNYEALHFYHKYVFNFSLYLTVFILWFIWVNKYGVMHNSNSITNEPR